jgi:hypothetical protein
MQIGRVGLLLLRHCESKWAVIFFKCVIHRSFTAFRSIFNIGILLFIVKMDELIHGTPRRCRCTASVFWFAVQYLACSLASVK